MRVSPIDVIDIGNEVVVVDVAGRGAEPVGDLHDKHSGEAVDRLIPPVLCEGRGAGAGQGYTAPVNVRRRTNKATNSVAIERICLPGVVGLQQGSGRLTTAT